MEHYLLCPRFVQHLDFFFYLFFFLSTLAVCAEKDIWAPPCVPAFSMARAGAGALHSLVPYGSEFPSFCGRCGEGIEKTHRRLRNSSEFPLQCTLWDTQHAGRTGLSVIKGLKKSSHICGFFFCQCFIFKNRWIHFFLYIIALQQIHRTQVHASTVTHIMRTLLGLFLQSLNHEKLQCQTKEYN